MLSIDVLPHCHIITFKMHSIELRMLEIHKNQEEKRPSDANNFI